MRSLRISLLTAFALATDTGATAQKIDSFAFEAKTLGGQTITEKNFENNVLIVDLWGTWCKPCVQAVPVLEDLYRKYKQYGLEIVGFSYEANSPDPARTVRKFAAKHGLTYHLAMGTPAIKRQVPGFRAYPTLLYFNKGLAHDHTEVGYDPLHKKKMESWVRRAVGLAPEPGSEVIPPEPPEEEPEEVEEVDPEEPDPLPAGVIFKPGDGDTGFEWEAEDVDGEKLVFEELRGKTVLLVLTSTWDPEAANTAVLLNELHDSHSGENTVVVAASLEMAKQRAAKVRAIKAFRSAEADRDKDDKPDGVELRYRIVPCGLDIQKKIHMFSGMPLFLIFDKDGTLVLRESGASEKTHAAVKAALEQHSG